MSKNELRSLTSKEADYLAGIVIDQVRINTETPLDDISLQKSTIIRYLQNEARVFINSSGQHEFVSQDTSALPDNLSYVFEKQEVILVINKALDKINGPDWTMTALGDELKLPKQDVDEVVKAFDRLRNAFLGDLEALVPKIEPSFLFWLPQKPVLPEHKVESMPDGPISDYLLSHFLWVYNTIAPKEYRSQTHVQQQVPLTELQNLVSKIIEGPTLDIAEGFYQNASRLFAGLSFINPSKYSKEDVQLLSQFTSKVNLNGVDRLPRTLQKRTRLNYPETNAVFNYSSKSLTI